MTQYPDIKTVVCIMDVEKKIVREASAILSNLRGEDDKLYFTLDSISILPPLTKKNAYHTISKLTKLPVSEWDSIIQPPLAPELSQQVINSTPALMAITLLMKMELEVYPFLELPLFNFSKVPLVEQHKYQFIGFLGKKYNGGIIYTASGYDVQFLNLPIISNWANKNDIKYEDLFNSLVLIYESSLLGAVKFFWGKEEIYSNYFIPVHLPVNGAKSLNGITLQVWDFIKRTK